MVNETGTASAVETETKKPLTRADFERQQELYKASCVENLPTNLAEYQKVKAQLDTLRADIQLGGMSSFGTAAGQDPVNVLTAILKGGPMKLDAITEQALKWDCSAVDSQTKVEKVLRKGAKDIPATEKKKGSKKWCDEVSPGIWTSAEESE